MVTKLLNPVEITILTDLAPTTINRMYGRMIERTSYYVLFETNSFKIVLDLADLKSKTLKHKIL